MRRTSKAVHGWVVSVAVGFSVICAPALAQTWPVKPIRFIVPYPPGGGNDTISRLLAARVGTDFGQQLVVDNRPGAGTTIGTAMAAKAAPDGYTIVMSSAASHAMAPQLYANPGYDAVKDFTGVTLIATTPAMLITAATQPYRTMQELVGAAKAKPGTLSFASGGNGTPPHLASAVFASMTGTEFIHVPYKGSGPAHIDIMGGAVTMMIDTAASASPHVRSGKMRGLAITGKKRHADFPDVPTFIEAGLPGYDASSWYGVHAPAGTPRAVIDRLHRELVRIIRLPDMDERLRGMVADPVASTPEELDRFVLRELELWGKVIRAQKLKVD
jgi:tripartite-type tricarboxylate transporter receptor subunit TctC